MNKKSLMFSLIISVLFYGNVKSDVSNESLENATKQYNQRVKDFSTGNQLLITVTSKQKDVFNSETLSLIRKITNFSWSLNGVIRVDSLANFQVASINLNDDFRLKELYAAEKRYTKNKVLNIKNKIKKEQEVIGYTLSPDYKTSTIILTFSPGYGAKKAKPAIDKLRQRLSDLLKYQACCDIGLTGTDVQYYVDFSLPTTEIQQWHNNNWPFISKYSPVEVARIEFCFNKISKEKFLSMRKVKKIDKFVKWLRQRNEVVHVQSISDIVNRINKTIRRTFNDYSSPVSNRLISQYIQLYEMSLPVGLGLDPYLNKDKRKTRVVVSIINLSEDKYVVFQNAIFKKINELKLL